MKTPDKHSLFMCPLGNVGSGSVPVLLLCRVAHGRA